MSRKGRSTLVLLGCIIALGVFIWLQESWRARTPSKEYQRAKLFDMDARTLSSLQFSLSNTVIKCERVNGIWMVGDNERGIGRADLALFYRMVAEINQMGKGTVITAKQLEVRGLNASEYGFNPPSTEIVAIDNKGRHSWSIGRTTPLGDMVYVMEAGRGDIFTVPNLLLQWVPTSADVLRDRVLFPVDAAAIRQVEVRGPAGYIRLLKDPPNGWSIQQPTVAKADPQEVETYIRQLCELRVESFEADNVSDLSAYGLQGDARQVCLGSSDGSARTLVLGDEIPDRAGYAYARMANDTSVFSLPSKVFQLLDVPAKHFRDARVLSLPTESITSVHVKRGAEQIGMERDSSGAWKVTRPVAWAADPAEVANLITLWEHAVITEFKVENPSGEVEWTFEFAASGAGVTNRIEVLAVGDRKDGLLVRRDDDPTVVQINLPELPASVVNPLIYKDKHIWHLRKDDISKLAIIRPNQLRQVVERSVDGLFVAAETNGNQQVNYVALNKAINTLADMQTPGYITYNPRSLATYGLAEPSLELHVGLSDTNELGRILLVGREAPDGFYAMVKGRDVVFYLDKETVDALFGDLVNHPNIPAPTTE